MTNRSHLALVFSFFVSLLATGLLAHAENPPDVSCDDAFEFIKTEVQLNNDNISCEDILCASHNYNNIGACEGDVAGPNGFTYLPPLSHKVGNYMESRPHSHKNRHKLNTSFLKTLLSYNGLCGSKSPDETRHDEYNSSGTFMGVKSTGAGDKLIPQKEIEKGVLLHTLSEPLILRNKKTGDVESSVDGLSEAYKDWVSVLAKEDEITICDPNLKNGERKKCLAKSEKELQAFIESITSELPKKRDNIMSVVFNHMAKDPICVKRVCRDDKSCTGSFDLGTLTKKIESNPEFKLKAVETEEERTETQHNNDD